MACRWLISTKQLRKRRPHCSRRARPSQPPHLHRPQVVGEGVARHRWAFVAACCRCSQPGILLLQQQPPCNGERPAGRFGRPRRRRRRRRCCCWCIAASCCCVAASVAARVVAMVEVEPQGAPHSTRRLRRARFAWIGWGGSWTGARLQHCVTDGNTPARWWVLSMGSTCSLPPPPSPLRKEANISRSSLRRWASSRSSRRSCSSPVPNRGEVSASAVLPRSMPQASDALRLRTPAWCSPRLAASAAACGVPS